MAFTYISLQTLGETCFFRWGSVVWSGGKHQATSRCLVFSIGFGHVFLLEIHVFHLVRWLDWIIKNPRFLMFGFYFLVSAYYGFVFNHENHFSDFRDWTLTHFYCTLFHSLGAICSISFASISILGVQFFFFLTCSCFYTLGLDPTLPFKDRKINFDYQIERFSILGI